MPEPVKPTQGKKPSVIKSDVRSISRYTRLLTRAEDDIQTIEAKASEIGSLLTALQGMEQVKGVAPVQQKLSQIADALSVIEGITSYYQVEG